jgi:hypothetical protein
VTVRPATDDDLRGPGWLDDGTSDPGSEGPQPWTRMRRDPTAVREGVRPGPR